jgi:transposase
LRAHVLRNGVERGSTEDRDYDLVDVVSKTFRPYHPGQGFLLPPSPLDWLPQGHLAHFILDVVKELDLSKIYAHYNRELRGFPPHHPQMMLALLLYGYCVGIPSSRKIERKTHEDVAFRVLAGGEHPDHTRISEFRRIHLQSLAELFVQVLKLCRKAGLVKLGTVALDGTKIKANASKHKAMSYDRMNKEEQRLREKVAELLSKAEQVDTAEDAEHGASRADDLPKDLQRAEDRLRKIREAKAALEAEAKQRADEEKAAKFNKKDDQDPPSSEASTQLPKHRIPTTAEGVPTDKAQRNFTDADSRIMKTGDGYVQGYNCQAAVDSTSQVIVAEAVTNQPPDPEHLIPLLSQTIENCEGAPEKLLGDAGYFSENNVRGAQQLGSDPYLATGRQKHSETAASPNKSETTMTAKMLMAEKLATREGKAIYARRKAIVEPVFGQIKEARGFRRFLLRGIKKVRGEWSLISLTHNLLKLYAAPT